MNSFADLQDPIRVRLREIESLIGSGHLADAAVGLNALAATVPNDYRVHLIGTQLAEAAGNLDAARDSAARTLALAPESPLAQIEMARVHSRDGNHREAVALARAAHDQLPGDDLVAPRAVAIANAAADYSFAQALLATAREKAPDDASVIRAQGYNALHRAALDEALEFFEPLLAVNDDDALARTGRASANLRLGRMAAALTDYDWLLQRYPTEPSYQYYRAVAAGDAPTRMPAEVAANIFNEYAPHFDHHLLGALGYRAPQRLAEQVRERFPTLECNVLDLGCGTGLLGMLLGRTKGWLVGVDISKEMLDRAARHGVYDRFHQVDLLAALQGTQPDQYDVVAACDVLIYVGDASEFVAGAARVLRPGGLLLFTCERATPTEGALALRPSMRYAHSEAAMLSLCREHGLVDVSTESILLRKEAGDDVEGFIVSARKPT